MKTLTLTGLALAAVSLCGCGGSGAGVARITGPGSAPGVIPTYTVIDLGAFNPGTSKSINDNGQAIVLDKTGTFTNIVNAQTAALIQHIPGADYSSSLNNGGVVATALGNGIGVPYSALTYTPPAYTNSTMTPQSFSTSINAAGNFVGQSWNSNAGYFWTDGNATPTTLQPYQGNATQFVSPTCINDNQEIVGDSQLPNGGGTSAHAMYLASPSSAPVRLNEKTADYSFALYITNSGKIYGSLGYNSDASLHGVVWNTPNSVPVDLGTLAPGNGTPGVFARAANESGVVVGSDTGSTSGQFACVYYPGIGMVDLFAHCDSSRTGWLFNNGTSINSQGRIYGAGFFNNVQHVFVAIPNS